MSSKKQNEKKSKNKSNPYLKEDLKKYIAYLEIDKNYNNLGKEKGLQKLFKIYKEFLEKVHKKGRKKLTIMLIPHSESSILNLHLNYYTLFISLFIVLIIIIISTAILIYRNAQNMEYYDIGITNKQFYLQTSKLGSEVIPLHKNVTSFAEKIVKVYNYLGISFDKPQGGISKKIDYVQIEDLKKLIEECKEKKESCEKETIKKILETSLKISLLNYEIIKEVHKKIDEIGKVVNDPSFQNFYKYIPIGLPVEGCIKNSFKTSYMIEKGSKTPLSGIEIATFPYSPIKTLAPGKVIDIDYDPIFGLYVWIEHIPGLKTFYAHLGEVVVKKNQFVENGQIIGYTGKTGFTNNKNILYYEIHIGNMVFNPHVLIGDVQTLWLNHQKY